MTLALILGFYFILLALAGSLACTGVLWACLCISREEL